LAFAGWFLCQCVGIAVPILFAANAAAEEVCVCPHAEEGAACPMHQANKTPERGGVLKNACTPTDAALLSMLTGTGILPAPVATGASRPVSQRILACVAEPASVVLLSDAPPPRA
jgi:hypothetical protein